MSFLRAVGYGLVQWEDLSPEQKTIYTNRIRAELRHQGFHLTALKARNWHQFAKQTDTVETFIISRKGRGGKRCRTKFNAKGPPRAACRAVLDAFP